MILICGATGNIGGHVLDALSARGVRPRALVRNPASAQAIARRGADVAIADLSQPESLRSALDGIEKLYLMTPSSPEQPEQQARIAELARAAGVRHIVRLSGARSHPQHPGRVYRWHHETEERIRHVGIALTSVRPVYFMQNLAAFYLGRSIRAQQEWVGIMDPDFAFNLIDVRDIAAVIATCLCEEGHEGRNYDLTGPENLSSAQQAAAISQAIGRPVRYRALSTDAYAGMLGATGMLPRSAIESVIEIHANLDTFRTNTVEEVTKRLPHTFAQFLETHAHLFQPPRAPKPLTTHARAPMNADTSSPTRRRVLVTGATGRQGGAAVDALLASGHQLRALVRDPATEAARALAARGVELVAGDFAEKNSLLRACTGVDAVFAVTTPFGGAVDPDRERHQGRALVEAAKATGEPHFVYTSAANADRDTGIPHFQSKREVEQFLIGSGLPYTIIAPASFMENLLTPPRLMALEDGLIGSPFSDDHRVRAIAVEDIGRFAALVINQPDRFLGRRIDIAGDESTGVEMARVLTDVLGRPIRHVTLPPQLLAAGSETMLRAFEFLKRTGYEVDIQGLRNAYPEVGWHDFATWARSLAWGPLGREPIAG